MKNLNCDLIIGLPGQNKKGIYKNLKTLSEFEIPHLSVYILEHVLKGDIFNQRASDLYYHSKTSLEQLGYQHYEISNYAKPGFECKHNIKYWNNRDYIGAGLSASGFERGIDYKNTIDLKEYFRAISEQKLPEMEKNNHALHSNCR